MASARGGIGGPAGVALEEADGGVPIAGAVSEQRLGASGRNTPGPTRRPGGHTGVEDRLDGVGDELGGLGVDGGAAAQQHPPDDVAGMPGRVVQAVGHVSPLS